jgi:hypothetical protein
MPKNGPPVVLFADVLEHKRDVRHLPVEQWLQPLHVAEFGVNVIDERLHKLLFREQNLVDFLNQRPKYFGEDVR